MSEELSAATGLRLSFLELIEHYQYVEIPLLQRDYAQGRTSPTARAVRELFVANLLDALTRDKPLSLDLVYGEVVTRRFQSIGQQRLTTLFQPIDGQQRLTTLFLLHWFLACAEDKLNDFQLRMKDEGGKPRFRYAVRQSSQRFLSKLLDYCPIDLNKSLFEEIKDRAWFVRAWLYDPTIVGVLTMIDAIREKCVSTPGFRGFYHKLALTNQPKITVDVLNLGSMGLSDEIYIKMNARGKDLTGFEKFKAWLTHENLLGSEKPGGGNQWPVLLDGDWLNLFWHFHKDDTEPADRVSKVYFRTFVALAVNYHALAGRFEDTWKEADADHQETLWKQLFTQESLGAVFQWLQALSPRDDNGEWPIISLRQRLEVSGVTPFDVRLEDVFFEGTSEEVTLGMRLWLHAICLIAAKDIRGGREEVHWFRVVRNLLANTKVEAKTFANAIQSLSELGRLHAEKGSTLQALQDLADDVSLVGLNTEQLKEEKRKAVMIAHPTFGSAWEAAIKQAEAHPILRGQIGLLLPETDDLDTFKKRWAVFDLLFDENGSRIGKEEYLLARSVLAHSDPIKLEWQRRISLLDSRSKWSELLDRSSEWPPFRVGMGKLIDHLTGSSDLEASMRKCLETLQIAEPWMLDIIRYGGDLLSQSVTQKVQNYYGHGVFLFHKTYANPGDLLLGPKGFLRNRLIQRLVDQSEARWEGASAISLTPQGEQEPKVFFKNHYIKLTNKDPNGVVIVRFEYQHLVVGSPSFESDDIQLQYPDDGDLGKFHDSLDETLNSGSTDQRKATVLRELSQAWTFSPSDKWG